MGAGFTIRYSFLASMPLIGPNLRKNKSNTEVHYIPSLILLYYQFRLIKVDLAIGLTVVVTTEVVRQRWRRLSCDWTQGPRSAELRGPGGQLTHHFFEYAVHMRLLTPHFLSDISTSIPTFRYPPQPDSTWTFWTSLLLAKYCDEHVCVSVCPRGYLRNYRRDLYQICRVSCLWPWWSVLLRHGDEIAKRRGWLVGWSLTAFSTQCRRGQFWGFSSPSTMHCTA